MGALVRRGAAAKPGGAAVDDVANGGGAERRRGRRHSGDQRLNRDVRSSLLARAGPLCGDRDSLHAAPDCVVVYLRLQGAAAGRLRKEVRAAAEVI